MEIVSICVDCEENVYPAEDFEFVPELGFPVHESCCTDPRAVLDRIVHRTREHTEHKQRFKFEPLPPSDAAVRALLTV